MLKHPLDQTFMCVGSEFVTNSYFTMKNQCIRGENIERIRGPCNEKGNEKHNEMKWANTISVTCKKLTVLLTS